MSATALRRVDVVAPAADDPVEVQPLALDADMTLTVCASAPGGATPLRANVPLQNRLTKISALGRGAMGEVWLARDVGLCRRVAYKHLLPQHADNPDLAARFFEEVQVTAQLDHPNILPIYNLESTPEGTPAYSMKLVQGKTLSALIKEARANLAARSTDYRTVAASHIDIFLRICDGMSYAHSKGVLHRDLKPDNVMVGRYSEVYIMDWGICRVMGSAGAEARDLDPDRTMAIEASDAPELRTQFGAVLGTPSYMSPEQALGQNATLDARSDLYTLGLILQELLTLERARRAKSYDDMMRIAARGDRGEVRPWAKGQVITPEMRAIIARATAPARDERYASIAEFADDIRRHLREDPIRAMPDTVARKLHRFANRHGRMVMAGFVALLLLGAISTLATQFRAEKARYVGELRANTLNAFTTESAHQQELIDEQIYRFELALAQLAGRAAQTLAAPPPNATIYGPRDFDAGHVPGIAPSQAHAMPVSLDHGMVLAPSTPTPTAEGELRAMAALAPAFRNVLVRARGLAPESMDSAQMRTLVTARDVPVLDASLTLADGALVAYPGHGNMPSDYDPLTRPKYLAAVGKTGIQWGTPYADRYGRGVLLPASLAIYDDRQQYLGVVSIDVRFAQLVARFAEATHADYVSEALLLDGEGRVMVRSGPTNDAALAVKSDARDLANQEGPRSATDLPVHPRFAEISAAKKDFGGFEDTERGQLVGYYRLKSLGWWFVTVADGARLSAHFATTAR